MAKKEAFSKAAGLPENPLAVNAKTAVRTPETFEIPAVSEELYLQTRKALEKESYTFVVAIKSVSIDQLITDGATSQRFEHVYPSENIRGTVSPQMEVAINPKQLRIKGSNSKPTGTQIQMIKDEEARLKGKLPQEVRDFISMCMQGASVLAQLDGEYKKGTGKVLFTDWFGRTNDQAFPDVVASVGRYNSTLGLRVYGSRRGLGDGDIFAVPVVVLPRKLAV